MARETRKTEIHGTTYSILGFPATAGLQLGIEIGRIGAPVLAKAVEDKGQDVAAFMIGAVDAILGSMSSAETVQLIKRLLGCVTAEGVGPVSGDAFDLHFRDRLADLPALLREVIDHNFSDFFSALPALVDNGKGSRGA